MKKIGILIIAFILLFTCAFDAIIEPEDQQRSDESDFFQEWSETGGDFSLDTENPDPAYEDPGTVWEEPTAETLYEWTYEEPVYEVPTEVPPTEEPVYEPTATEEPVLPVWEGIEPDQMDLLQALFDEMTPTGKAYSGWFSGMNYAPCTWQGITCEYGTVTGLKFERVGYFTTFPEALLKFAELKELHMVDTMLKGPLPERLFEDLPKLEVLELKGNFLTGEIPPLPEAFQFYPMLREIVISDNLGDDSRKSQLLWGAEYADVIYFQPDPYEYTDVDLTPGLDGELPADWARLPLLGEIDLSGNQLRGSVPDSWEMLPLAKLNVSENGYGFEISEEFYTYLLSLGNLDIRLDGILAPAPTEIPTEIPTEVPTEIPTEIPTEVPTDEPVYIPPTDIPVYEDPTEEVYVTPMNIYEVPTEVPYIPPTEVPTQVPPTEVPTQVPTQVPPTEIPTQVPTQVPPTEVPTQVPTQKPIIIVVTATPQPRWYTATSAPRYYTATPQPYYYPQQPYYYPTAQPQYYYPTAQPQYYYPTATPYTYTNPGWVYPTATSYTYTNPGWVYPTATSSYTYPQYGQTAPTAAPTQDPASQMGFTYVLEAMTNNDIPMTWRYTGMTEYSINYLDASGNLYPAFAMEWTPASQICTGSACNASVSVPDELLRGGKFSLQLRARDTAGRIYVSDPVEMEVSAPEPVPTPTPEPEHHSVIGDFFRWLFGPIIRLFGGK